MYINFHVIIVPIMYLFERLERLTRHAFFQPERRSLVEGVRSREDLHLDRSRVGKQLEESIDSATWAH